MGTTPYFILLFIHLSGLVLGFGAVLVTDLYGLLWVRDRVRFPQLVRVSELNEKFIWGGWGTMVAAGIPLIVLKGMVDELMMVKLFFVGLIGVNGLVLHYLHKHIEGYAKGDDVPNITMFRLTLSLIVSQIAWWGAMLIGFLHRQVQTVIEWPDTPWLVSGAILAGILVLWAAGEALLRGTGKAVEA
jgi:hypothetical protein